MGETTPNLAALLEPGTPNVRTPAEALRAVGHYLDRERPVPTESAEDGPQSTSSGPAA